MKLTFKILDKIEFILENKYDCVRFRVKCLSCGYVSAIPTHWQFFECEHPHCNSHANLWEMKEEWEKEIEKVEAIEELWKFMGMQAKKE